MYNQYIQTGGFCPVEQAPSSREGGLLERLLGGLTGGKGGVLPGLGNLSGLLKLDQLDTGDILLVLILIFLFRESEDEEWFIILALVLLMGL